MSYIDERRFAASEKLKPYDAFAKELPITYTLGCVRHIAKPLNREIIDCVPGFGRIITDPQVKPAVEDNCAYYKKLLAIDLLLNVYGDQNAYTTDCMDLSPELVDEIIMRFYPSNHDWWISEDGRGYVCGILDEPRKHLKILEEMMGDSEKRKYHFQISRVPTESQL